jgi:hypothetical protein
MDTESLREIETQLLAELVTANPINWQAGTAQIHTLMDGAGAKSVATLNLSFQGVSEEVRNEALQILREKYHVNAHLKESRSFVPGQKTWVLRFMDADDGISQVTALRWLAAPQAWRATVISGEAVQDLYLARLNSSQIKLIERVLTEQGIPSWVTEALDGDRNVKVARVQGDADIRTLANKIPTLAGLSQPSSPVLSLSTAAQQATSASPTHTFALDQIAQVINIANRMEQHTLDTRNVTVGDSGAFARLMSSLGFDRGRPGHFGRNYMKENRIKSFAIADVTVAARFFRVRLGDEAYGFLPNYTATNETLATSRRKIDASGIVVKRR